MSIPAGVELRRPQDSDADAVLVFVLATACDAADFGRADRALADVRERWARPDVDLSRDAWIMLDAGGDALAYALLIDTEAEILVHPRARTLGLGSHLRELIEERAAERGLATIEQQVVGGNRTAERQLETAGYEATGNVWQLERPLDVQPDQPSFPRGITARRLRDADDAVEVHALFERAVADVAPVGATPRSLEQFATDHLAEDRLDPDMWVLAHQRERLVGATICETWDERSGEVTLLAVEHELRNRGVGRALLLSAFRLLGEQGAQSVTIRVRGADERVLELYESVGMRPVWRQTRWRKRLVV
jgi:mycothiol synthase